MFIFPISPGYHSRPMRNQRQWLFNFSFFGWGQQGALAIRGRLGKERKEGGGVRASVYLQIRPLTQVSLPP